MEFFLHIYILNAVRCP